MYEEEEEETANTTYQPRTQGFTPVLHIRAAF